MGLVQEQTRALVDTRAALHQKTDEMTLLQESLTKALARVATLQSEGEKTEFALSLQRREMLGLRLQLAKAGGQEDRREEERK